MISGFGTVLLFAVGSLAFLVVTLFIGYILRPNRPNIEKNELYECGENAVGEAWAQINIRFYIVALIFILFDIEIVFIFPWVLIYNSEELQAATQGMWSWIALAEMLVFIFILTLGLVYAWNKGYLNWEKPKVTIPGTNTKIPKEAYGKYLKA